MSEYFEIAYAALNNRLCLFTGTGFSKAISDNKAPTWQGLLEGLCVDNHGLEEVRTSLFPSSGRNPLSLEEAAQVIAIELLKQEKKIHQEIAARISSITLDKDIDEIRGFCESHRFKVVTTNYDKLMEQLCGTADCQSLTPGLPIPRSSARVRVYHVHGSVDVPENMVVTADDYFKFLNSESYFSRKLSTVLHENTVVILGYSLGDTNLKAILSEYNGFARNHVIASNIFLVSRGTVDRPLKDYYSNCYGIRVIDETTISDFFSGVTQEIPSAKECIDTSVGNVRKVVLEGRRFSESYLRLEDSFYEIVSSISAIGLSIDHSGVVKMFGDIIQRKSDLTKESGAWEQYTHFAHWLIYLGTILNVKATSIENIYLEAVKRSMETMSKEQLFGYSWQSYKAWRAKWDSITPANRSLIASYLTIHSRGKDALSIISLG
ncbi:MAG: SIR2 family NAD-dependent protein deacylase [Pseudomonadota bacterium]